MSTDELLGVIAVILLWLLVQSMGDIRKEQDRQRERIRKLEARAGIPPEERL